MLFCNPKDCNPPSSFCPWDFPGKNTGVGCHFLLQAIFSTQGLNLHLLHWQADSLQLSHQGSPEHRGEFLKILLVKSSCLFGICGELGGSQKRRVSHIQWTLRMLSQGEVMGFDLVESWLLVRKTSTNRLVELSTAASGPGPASVDLKSTRIRIVKPLLWEKVMRIKVKEIGRKYGSLSNKMID